MATIAKPFLAGLAIATMVVSPMTFAADTTGVTEDTIKIGVPGPFTGDASSYAAAEIGITAYYKWVNDQGGIHGRKIVPIQIDTACSEVAGIAAIKKLIHDNKVFLINGVSCSGVGLAVKPIVIQEKVPLVISQAVNQNISAPASPYIFHGVPTSADAARSIVDFAVSAPGELKLAIVSHSNEWGKGYRDPQVEYLKNEYDMEPMLDLAMERGSTFATPQVLKIRSSEANFVILNLYEVETAIFLQEARKYGLDIPMMGGYGTNLQDISERTANFEAVKNYCVLHQFVGLLGSPEMARWGEMIHEYYPDEELTAFSFTGIGSAIAVVEALKNAGRELTREKFIAEMDKLRNFRTDVLAGAVTFTPDDHQGVKQSAVACFVAGEPALLQSWGVALNTASK